MKDNTKIVLKGLRFFGNHGVHSEERARGQWFELDIEIGADLSKAALLDDLQETLDYGEVYRAIKRVVEGPPVNLLEHLAELVMQEIFKFPQAQKAFVLLKKPEVELGGSVLYAGIEMYRSRDEN